MRAKQLPPEQYCNYVMASGGTLKVYNADSKAMDEVAEANWHEACPEKEPIIMSTQNEHNNLNPPIEARTEIKLSLRRDKEAYLNVESREKSNQR